MKKPRRFRVGRLFKRASPVEAPVEPPRTEPTVEKSVQSSEVPQVEMTMATEPTKAPATDVAALRDEVELLELRVRKLQALQWLQNHRAGRAAAKKG